MGSHRKTALHGSDDAMNDSRVFNGLWPLLHHLGAVGNLHANMLAGVKLSISIYFDLYNFEFGIKRAGHTNLTQR